MVFAAYNRLQIVQLYSCQLRSLCICNFSNESFWTSFMRNSSSLLQMNCFACHFPTVFIMMSSSDIMKKIVVDWPCNLSLPRTATSPYLSVAIIVPEERISKVLSCYFGHAYWISNFVMPMNMLYKLSCYNKDKPHQADCRVVNHRRCCEEGFKPWRMHEIIFAQLWNVVNSYHCCRMHH